jgi:menaquinone-dependent protoporphyrinogen IX oxidase
MMKRLIKLAYVIGVLFLSFVLSSCSSLSTEIYTKEQPVLKLEQYFSGKLIGHGMVMDRFGEVTRRFVVNINGTLSKDSSGIETLTLDEKFDWSDGKKETRVWTLKRVASGEWSGTAADVVGSAVGKVAGNALNWRYVLALPVKDSVYNLDFDDWMFLVDDKVMLNKAVFSKFGIRLGEILISFQKQS